MNVKYNRIAQLRCYFNNLSLNLARQRSVRERKERNISFLIHLMAAIYAYERLELHHRAGRRILRY
jgi:hypothetical protein